MSKQFKPGRTIVMPRASRIRRDPPPVEKEKFWRSRDWERRLAVAGVLLFALALTGLIVAFGHLTWSSDGPPLELTFNAGAE